ncbi:MAG: LysM peptidoglycan-binding domain-containing protein [Bacteroidia bacterium]|nr:LysM peptidoglycan-binding domain-containing protein [Bacteroidia bacterium]
MRTSTLLAACFACGMFSLHAQKPVVSPKWLEADSAAAPAPEYPAETKGSQFLELEDAPIEERLDDFIKNFHFARPSSSVYDTLLRNTQNFRPEDVPQYPAHVTRQRLYELRTVIPMDYNEYVQHYIDLYTLRRREQMSRMLGLSTVYFPIFEEHFDRMGLPMELKYLAIVESALNPHAVSRVGATGLWQFMLATGREYDLSVDSYIDERRDPVKSTIAAAKYLRNAYTEFGDWLLAIASYNCGEGNVRKAIARSGGKRSFWEIRAYLPAETRGYVPAFIAATYAFEYASAHNLYPVYPDMRLDQDTVHLRSLDMTLQEVAQICNTDYHTLKNLNPELKIDRIPYSSEPYVLKTPARAAELFAANYSRIRSQYGQRREGAVYYASAQAGDSRSAALPVVRTASVSEPKPAGKLVYHTVRSGEVVGSIAEKYGVTPAQIARWNSLRRYQIRAGQRLKIYTAQSYAAVQAAPRTSSGPATASVSPAVAQASPVRSSSQVVLHTVRPGETLWGIANMYPDVDLQDILALNLGLNARDLKVGQKIRIK